MDAIDREVSTSDLPRRTGGDLRWGCGTNAKRSFFWAITFLLEPLLFWAIIIWAHILFRPAPSRNCPRFFFGGWGTIYELFEPPAALGAFCSCPIPILCGDSAWSTYPAIGHSWAGPEYGCHISHIYSCLRTYPSRKCSVFQKGWGGWEVKWCWMMWGCCLKTVPVYPSAWIFGQWLGYDRWAAALSSVSSDTTAGHSKQK